MQNCRDVLQSARTIAIESSTFLALNYLLPFVTNVEHAIIDLESNLKERFSTKVTLASGHQLTKRYPLHEPGRRLKIVIPLTNEGPGKLVGLRASVAATDGFSVGNEKIIMGDVTPGRFAIVMDGEVTRSIDYCEVLIDLEWDEIGSSAPKSEIFEIRVSAQTMSVDWKSIQFWAPYSTEPANGSEFVGRGEKVRQVASKMLRTPMEPFYITGQKRVGKTSLALAAVAFAQENAGLEEIRSQYILWGDVAYQDAHRTMHEIGSVFGDALRRHVDLREFDAIDCSDSLAPLVRLCHRAFEKDQKKKFVFIMDEFDEVHPEMYLHGTLAETFFANIRALTKCRNVCVVLIGGENMPYVMDRQGQRLNNFSRVSLSYYSRELEWDDYNLLVKSATIGVIDWHDDAIAELFNITNGNPYFTKIACAAVLRQAISGRDADVTYEEVRRVVFDEISSLGANYFAHLWQDGIPKPVEDREPEILVRVRVLVAIANCLRRGSELSIENISSAQGSRDLMGVGVGSVLDDFVRREVLDVREHRYRFLLPIFGSWLEDVGASALVETSLSKELAEAVLGAEEAAMVKADEIARLVKHWPTYRGRHVGSEEVRGWLSQVASLRQQRILFKLLQHLHFFTDLFIRERLATLHNVAVLPHLETLVQKRRSDKRRDVVVTYVDGEGKSGQIYASYYAEQNLIAGECICPPGEFGARYAKLVNNGIQVRYIVIVDDLAATGKSLSDNVREFVQRNQAVLQSDGLSVLVCTVAATQKASDYIYNSFSEYGNINIGFRSAEFLVEKDYAFSPGNGIWSDEGECSVARTLCVDLGIGIYGRKNPLGFGNLGILAVFPNSVPNNTLPILHSASRAGAVVPWAPLFARVIH